MDDHQTNLIVSALLRQGDHILLVQQQGLHDPSPTWALPGGVAKPGELLTEALARELREETGLEVNAWGGLIYIAQVDEPAGRTQSLAFVFEVVRWNGQLRSSDPDNLILDIRFLPIPEALQKLEALPWRAMREPVIAYLSREVGKGHVWQYRVESESVFMLSMATSSDPPK